MPKNKKVYQFTKEGKFVAAHKSTARAASIFGCDESTIRKARDLKRYAVGFAWRSTNDFSLTKIERSKSLPKILVFDIETTPLEAYVYQKSVWKANIGHDKVISEWFMLTWAAKWLFDDELMSDRVTSKEVAKEDDKRIVKSLWKLLDEADIVIAHNGDGFDVPNMNTRFLANGLPPCRPYQKIDTLKVAKKQFGFTHNGLDALAKLFGYDGKIKTDFDLWKRCKNGDSKALKEMETYNIQDVIALENVYLKLRPWVKSHPNISLYMEMNEEMCPNCGSNKLVEEGFYYTGVSKFPTLKCKDCGAYGRRRKSVFDKELRDNLLVGLAQ